MAPPTLETHQRAARRAARQPVDLTEGMRDMRYRPPRFVAALLAVDNYRRLARAVSLVLLDAAMVYLALFTALGLKEMVLAQFSVGRVHHLAAEFAPFVILVTVLLFARSGMYEHKTARPGMTRVFGSLFSVAVVALVYAKFNGEQFSSYYIFYGTFLFASLYVIGSRMAYDRVLSEALRRLGHTRRAILVGTGDDIGSVAAALDDSRHRYDAIGFLAVEPRDGERIPSLGQLSDLPRLLDERPVDEVIVADHDFPDDLAVELVDQCHQRGVTVRIAPSTMELLVGRAEFVPGEPVPLFELKPPVFEGIDFVLKRTFDFVGSLLFLIVLSPLLLLITAMIRLTSRGPALYRSERPGIGGRAFACLKFRTMQIDADHRQAELEEANEATGPLFKIRRDPRVTRIGALLRRYSLDELPQLFNVLKGEMSLVGPRPLPMRDYARLEEWHKKRYFVMPGITGLWQISGRSDLDFDDLVRLDFLYLERWSVFLDVTILLKTVPAVLLSRGAY